MATRCCSILTLRRMLFPSLSYTVLSLIASTVYGQFTTVINSPPTNIGDDEGIGSDTQPNIFEGGTVGTRFSAGAGFETSNIEVNVFGGTVGDNFDAYSGSRVTIFGGSVGRSRQVTITGGSVGRAFRAGDGSQVTISGGTFDDDFIALDGSQVTISGGEFRLNGILVEGLESIGATVPLNAPDGTLSGVLKDGTPFSFVQGGFSAGLSGEYGHFSPGTLTLELCALPAVGPPLITASTDPIPLGIREGQTLAVDAGGVVGDDFKAGWGVLTGNV